MSVCKTSPEKTQEEPLLGVTGGGGGVAWAVTMTMTALGRTTNGKAAFLPIPLGE